MLVLIRELREVLIPVLEAPAGLQVVRLFSAAESLR